MDDLVNVMQGIQTKTEGSGLRFHLEGDDFFITALNSESRLRIRRLYRPSSEDVKRYAAPDVLLILSNPTNRAAEVALEYNHIAIPLGQFRIVAPGVALTYQAAGRTQPATRQVRLSGRTGVVVETLLLDVARSWSVRDLSTSSQVSAPLAHRVVNRLEREGLLTSTGRGPDKTRSLSNARALAELWAQEEREPAPVVKGYLYAPSVESLAETVTNAIPGSAVGGIIAANTHKPVLTRVNPPIRIWIPSNLSTTSILLTGLRPTETGANLEFCQAPGDPWSVHMVDDRIPLVSKWRAWLETANVQGRAQELADALLSDLEQTRDERP